MIRLKSLLTEGSKLKIGATDRGVSVAKNLQSKLGLKPFQAAAIAGNFVEESGVRPDALQDMTGKGEYISGPIKIDGKTGYSFAQWTYKARQQSLADFALGQGLDITKNPLTTSIATDFVVNEFNGLFSNVLDKLKASKNLSSATNIVLKQYEMPADQGATALANRTANAQQILDKMGGDAAPSTTTKSDQTYSGVIAKKGDSTSTDKSLDKKLAKLAKSGYTGTAMSPSKSSTTTATSTQYVVKSGDTLSGIASKYNTTIANLKSKNSLKSDMIKPGQKLKIK